MARRAKDAVPRATAKVIPDTHDDKQFPAGIASTVRAMYTLWDIVANDGQIQQTPEQFCLTRGVAKKDGVALTFAELYGAVQDLYPNRERIDHTDIDDLSRVIYRIGAGGKERNLDFVDIRALAQFCGLPSGLWLAFTQCVSDERRAGEDRIAARETALAFVRAIRRVLDATEDYIKERPAGQPLFQKIYDQSGEKHLADMDVLKMWSDAFNAPDALGQYAPYSERKLGPSGA